MFDSFTNPDIEILDDISKSGITPPDKIILDGEIHRFGKKNSCWYVAHLHPIPICIYGDWKLGITRKYVHHNFNTSSPAERLQMRNTIKAIEKKRLEDKEQQNDEARRKAQKIWDESEPAMFHDYLKRKQVLPLGIRVNQHNNLLIPLMDGKAIQTLQIIQPDGTKRFLKGGKAKGMYYPIGLDEQPEKVLICEGFATGATLYMDTKTPVIVAFYAANLVPVAKVIRRQHPKAEILICGDDDHATGGNPGKKAAIAAANSCCGSWVLPDFSGLNVTHKDADFNDLYRLRLQARGCCNE